MDVETIAFKRGQLPHWLVADRSYFVTICRKGCLPTSVLKELAAERVELAGASAALVRRSLGEGGTRATQDLWMRRVLKIDAILDGANCAVRDLANAEAAGLLLGNLDWLRGRGWRIWAAAVMPSHMHIVLRNMEGRNGDLESDLGKYKNFTARAINAGRGARGTFWQREDFDHWCRDERQWLGFVDYTVRNPAAAGLVADWRDWPWTVVDEEARELLEGGGMSRA